MITQSELCVFAESVCGCSQQQAYTIERAGILRFFEKAAAGWENG